MLACVTIWGLLLEGQCAGDGKLALACSNVGRLSWIGIFGITYRMVPVIDRFSSVYKDMLMAQERNTQRKKKAIHKNH